MATTRRDTSAEKSVLSAKIASRYKDLLAELSETSGKTMTFLIERAVELLSSDEELRALIDANKRLDKARKRAAKPLKLRGK